MEGAGGAVQSPKTPRERGARQQHYQALLRVSKPCIPRIEADRAALNLDFRKADIPTHVIVETIDAVRSPPLPPDSCEQSPGNPPEAEFAVQFPHGPCQGISNQRLYFTHDFPSRRIAATRPFKACDGSTGYAKTTSVVALADHVSKMRMCEKKSPIRRDTPEFRQHIELNFAAL